MGILRLQPPLLWPIQQFEACNCTLVVREPPPPHKKRSLNGVLVNGFTIIHCNDLPSLDVSLCVQSVSCHCAFEQGEELAHLLDLHTRQPQQPCRVIWVLCAQLVFTQQAMQTSKNLIFVDIFVLDLEFAWVGFIFAEHCHWTRTRSRRIS